MADPAFAWGSLGHEVISLIAYKHLSPETRGIIESLVESARDDPTLLSTEEDLVVRKDYLPEDRARLAADLKDPDFVSWSTWADRFREWYPRSRRWHYVDLELSAPDIRAACGSHQASLAMQASIGPSDDCIIDKLSQFTDELRARKIAPAERVIALKFLIHFVGDVHQPLHASDNHDEGGNCELVRVRGFPAAMRLHTFWDNYVVQHGSMSAELLARTLDAKISAADQQQWTDVVRREFNSAGNPWAREWALESYQIAKSSIYYDNNDKFTVKVDCGASKSVVLSSDYTMEAQRIAEIQLEKAGIRLAYILDALLP